MSETTEPPDAAVRAGLHGLWSAVAPGWEKHAAEIDERAADLTEVLLDRASLRAGDRVLELACGPGGLGLAAAPRVAPGGEVVLSDVAEEMTRIALRRAAERGIENVAAKVIDLEEIAEPDSSYDVVLCREGLMFAVDPARAAGEIARVLRPGGQLALAVWGPRERNPWLGLVLDAVSAQIGIPVPPPGMPGPFALSDSERVRALLVGAGFDRVTVEEQPVAMRAGSFDEWWRRTVALAGPLEKMLEAQPPETLDAIRERVREAATPYAQGDGLELPGVTLVGAGRL